MQSDWLGVPVVMTTSFVPSPSKSAIVGLELIMAVSADIPIRVEMSFSHSFWPSCLYTTTLPLFVPRTILSRESPFTSAIVGELD